MSPIGSAGDRLVPPSSGMVLLTLAGSGYIPSSPASADQQNLFRLHLLRIWDNKSEGCTIIAGLLTTPLSCVYQVAIEEPRFQLMITICTCGLLYMQMLFSLRNPWRCRGGRPARVLDGFPFIASCSCISRQIFKSKCRGEAAGNCCSL